MASNNEGLNWKFGILGASLTHNRTRTLSSWCRECVWNRIKRSAPFTSPSTIRTLGARARQLCQFLLPSTGTGERKKAKTKQNKNEKKREKYDWMRVRMRYELWALSAYVRLQTMWMNDGWFSIIIIMWDVHSTHSIWPFKSCEMCEKKRSQPSRTRNAIKFTIHVEAKITFWVFPANSSQFGYTAVWKDLRPNRFALVATHSQHKWLFILLPMDALDTMGGN